MNGNVRSIINNPMLMEEWDWSKNTDLGLRPEDIFEKSSKKAWWICKICGHSWQTSVSIRSNGHGCPVCSRKRATSQPHIAQPLISTNTDLMAEWDKEKNDVLGLYPDKLTCGSSKKVWWRCKRCGHSWDAKPLSRNRGSGCPVCSRTKAKEQSQNTKLSYNALAENRPDLLDEWDYELNGDLSPFQVTVSSGQKVWWRCKQCNQEWQATVGHRSMGEGCPVCAGQKLVSGINDLATVNPKLAAEWDYENNALTPQQVSARNNIKAAWICSVCGHHWKALVSTRNSGTGCPQCQRNFHTSLPEQIVYFYVKQLFPEAINGYVFKYKGKPRSVDIYIPSLNLAIEYDGSRWHQNVERDLKKTKILDEKGIQLVRIRERDCPVLNDSSYCIPVDYEPSSYAYLNTGILAVIEYINLRYAMSVVASIDIESDFYQILSAFESDKREKSLAVVNPILANEWDYDKNGSVTPKQVIATSDKKFWWLCSECGYSWKSMVSARHYGHGCPRCAGLVVWEGVNDLKTKRPELELEWDYDRNDDLSPNKVSYRGDKKIWWLCQKCGFSWNARNADRSAGIGCPSCAGKAVDEGRTDLATINPTLADEWDYEKNGALTPRMVVGGSNKKVWWICKTCSYSWKADVYSRNIVGHGCPKCSRENRQIPFDPKKAISNTHPEIALEWDYEKNEGVLPENISYGSRTKYYWICQKCGNSWVATPNVRTTGHGCPVCAIQKQGESWHRQCVEKNNFMSWCIEQEKAFLLEEWDLEANGGQMPKNFSAGSNHAVGWICRTCGHKWSAKISNRGRGSGCPNCFDLRRKGEKNTQPVKSVNALPIWCEQNDRAKLLSEWDSDRNKYPPENYTFGSHTKVWWKCSDCHHEWEAVIKSRTTLGNGCPNCRKSRKKQLSK